MRPSAFTAALNGMAALAVGQTCFDEDCAKVIVVMRMDDTSVRGNRIQVLFYCVRGAPTPARLAFFYVSQGPTPARLARAFALARAAGAARLSARGGDTRYLNRDDREAAIEDSWMGRLRGDTESTQQPHHRLRRRKGLEPGEPQTRAALHRARAHLV